MTDTDTTPVSTAFAAPQPPRQEWWLAGEPLGPAFCTACARWAADFKPVGVQLPEGPPRRERACRACGSLERHRVLPLLLSGIARRGAELGLPAQGVVLDVAPTRILTQMLTNLPYQAVRIDFDPSADGRLVDLRASLTELPLDDASVHVLLCSHVLEHIPDDAAAMREIARVVTADGIGVLLVPQRRTVPTDEDPSVTPEVAAVRFGQADHVRYYGYDFVARLEAAGLQVVEVTAGALLGHHRDAVRALRLDSNETMWVVRPATGPALPDAETLTDLVRDELVSVLVASGTPTPAPATRAPAPEPAPKPTGPPARVVAPPPTFTQRAVRKARRTAGPAARKGARATAATLRKVADKLSG